MHPLSVRPWRRVVGAGAGIALVLTLGACGSKSPSPSAEPAATSSTTSTSVASTAAPDTSPPDTSTVDTVASVKLAVSEAYDAYWRTWEEAITAPVNPQHPGLDRYFTDIALERARTNLQKMVDKGTAGRPADNPVGKHTIRSIDTNGKVAYIEDCSVDDGVIYDVASGNVVDDNIATSLIAGTAINVDGEWKISNTLVKRRWDGVSLCVE
jgi:hypothetical protein